MHVRSLVLTLIASFLIPQFAAAQSQTVSPSELHRAISDASQTHQQNLSDVRAFFSTEQARAALKTAKVDYRKVDKAVATLSPEELARLAARTADAQQKYAGGALDNQQLTYIVIALATAVVILVLIEA
jgi:hypothetical protein